MNPHRIAADSQSRRPIDMAIGVLVGLRRCSPSEAFTEIADAARETGVGLGGVSRALVTLASGTTEEFDHPDPVIERWAQLLADAGHASIRS